MSGSIASSNSWEYVNTDETGFEQEGQRKETEGDNQFVLEVPKNHVLLQPGQRTSPAPHSQEEASATSSAVLANGVGRLTLKSDNCSSHGSVSSFVVVATTSAENPWKSHRSTFDDDTASYSHVPSAAESVVTTGSTATVSAAPSGTSSVISNFDILSLSGRAYRRCKRCSYLNQEKDTICLECDLALVSNPCLDIDAQIAMNLAMKEEEEAFQILIRSERKRKNLSSAPLYERAGLFVDDTKAAISKLPKEIKTLHEGSFILLASNFIDEVDAQKGKHKVSLAFLFTRNDPVTLEKIRRIGFGGEVEVCRDADTALQAFNDPGMTRRGESLFSIPEHSHPSQPSVIESIGWIVAIVESPSIKVSEHPICRGSIVDHTKRLQKTTQVLPLVSFPTSQRNSSDVQNRAYGCLKRVCDDYFHPDAPETENDDDLARAIAASLEEYPVNQKKAKVDPGMNNDGIDEEEPNEYHTAIAASLEEYPVNQKKAKVDPGTNNDGSGEEESNDHHDALSLAIASLEQDFIFGSNSAENGISSSDAMDSYVQDAAYSDDTDKDDFEPLPWKPDGWADSEQEKKGSEIKENKEREDDDLRHPVENTIDPMVGKRVQLLGGSFQGQIGKITDADCSHFRVVIETIRSHKPSLMVARDHVKEVGTTKVAPTSF